MTPERWQRIDDLFNEALERPPFERDEWLRLACANDRALEHEVNRLLRQDQEAGESKFLNTADATPDNAEGTASWPDSPNPAASPANNHAANGRDTATPFRLDTDSQGFTPKAVIAPAEDPASSDELRSTVQARLREIPIIHACIFGVMLGLRPYLLAYTLAPIWYANCAAIGVLIACSILLSRKIAFSLWQLRAIELGIMGMLTTLVVFYEFTMFVSLSMDNDAVGAQLLMKNIVLICSLLILTFGVYVPKSWRRTAAVVFPLSLLPLTTMQVAYHLHPDTFGWILVPRNNRSVPIISYGLDALFLFLLAAISSFSAHVLSNLRRQVAEARLLGQYRLGDRIGKGGMGDVYLAEHRLLKRPCALKLIRTNGVGSANHLARFEREVRLTSTLSHPNTIEIYDYGRTEDGTYYYVMEFLPGLSLADLVARHGPLPPGRVVYLLRQVCQALSEAHAKGLIHRDVKPSNIFAAKRGGMDDFAKLLDFGLVRPVATVRSPHVSAEGQILGTPLYMSPEQATGTNELDGRSDLYSLGAVAYYLLTGRPPFDEKTGISAMIAHARDQAIHPSVLRPEIPSDLEEVVLRCLAKNPADRDPDAATLEERLASCECASDWDRVTARDWWRSVGRPVCPTMPKV